MSSEIIRAYYPVLEAVAGTFLNERDRVRGILDSVQRHVETLRSGGWISESSVQFSREMHDDILPSLNRLVEALGAASDKTHEIIQIMRKAEKEAAARLPRENDWLETAAVSEAATNLNRLQSDRDTVGRNYTKMSSVARARWQIDGFNDPYQEACELLSSHENFRIGMSLASCSEPAEDHFLVLDLIATFAAREAPVATGTLYHYLNGDWLNLWHRVPVFINPHQIFQDTALDVNGLTNMEKLTTQPGMLSSMWSEFLYESHLDPFTLFHGHPLMNFQNGVVIEPTAGNWLPFNYLFHGVNLKNSLSFATVRPTGDLNVSYEIDTNRNVIVMEVSQPIELVDRYDWSGDPIAINPETGLVRLYPKEFDGYILPGGELDPASNTLIQIIDDPAQIESNGFTRIEYAPDTPNWGGWADLISGAGPGLTSNGRVFGTPDHPDPRPLGDGFFTGQFLALESAGYAGPFWVYSGWDHPITYEIPYSISSDGLIQIMGNPQIVALSGSTNYVDVNDPAVLTLEESNYDPAGREYEMDTRPH